MKEEIIFSGFGGQGVLFCGKLLAFAGMRQGLHVTAMPSYGAEVRGGTAHCHVVLSDMPVASPVVDNPTIAVIMNPLAMKKFAPKIRQDGLLLINSSLVDAAAARRDVRATGVEVLECPATKLAEELGDMRIANMAMMGALSAKLPAFSVETLCDALAEFLPEHRKNLLPLNIKVLKAGFASVVPA